MKKAGELLTLLAIFIFYSALSPGNPGRQNKGLEGRALYVCGVGRQEGKRGLLWRVLMPYVAVCFGNIN